MSSLLPVFTAIVTVSVTVSVTALSASHASAQESASDVTSEVTSEPLSSPTGAAIQVRPSVELEMEREITVGDIAEFSGFQEEEIGEFKSVRLGDAPARGESRTFTSVGLSQIFRSYLPRLQGGREDRIQLTIPAKVVVTRKTFRLEASAVETEIIRQMKAVCSACEFEIEGLQLPLIGQDLPVGTTWQLKMRSELPKGSFSAPLELSGPEGRRVFWVAGRMSVFKSVPVATRAIEPGERIHVNDVSFERRDVTFKHDSFPTMAEMAGSIAARAIAADSFIGRALLRREQALKTGEPVKVVAGGGEWQVSIEGLAQSGGFVGDIVRVRIPRTQKVLSGVLQDKGLVEVR